MPRGVPRIPEAREWMLTKVCTVCAERKPWAEFSPHSYNDDGTVKYVGSRCHRCDSQRDKPRKRAYRERERERLNAYIREWRRERRKQGRREVFLPVGPMRAWVLEKVAEVDGEGGWRELATRWKVPERSLYRIVRQSEFVSLLLADKCASAAGEHLSDIYPDYSSPDFVLVDQSFIRQRMLQRAGK